MWIHTHWSTLICPVIRYLRWEEPRWFQLSLLQVGFTASTYYILHKSVVDLRIERRDEREKERGERQKEIHTS